MIFREVKKLNQLKKDYHVPDANQYAIESEYYTRLAESGDLLPKKGPNYAVTEHQQYNQNQKEF